MDRREIIIRIVGSLLMGAVILWVGTAIGKAALQRRNLGTPATPTIVTNQPSAGTMR